MRSRELAALIWLTLVLVATVYVGHRFANTTPLETDLLALLPQTERSATAEAAVRALSEQLGNRALFLVGHADPEHARHAARGFAARLEASGAFKRVIAAAPEVDPLALGRTYIPHRAGLLAPGDRDALSASSFSAQTALLRRLHQPFQTGIATDPTYDPFGFLQRWLTQLPFVRTQLMPSDGMLTVRDAQETWVLVVAEPLGSAFAATTQVRVIAAVANAEATLRDETPSASLLRTGAVFYGDAARAGAEREVDMIGGGSLIGILVMMWLLFRSLQPLALSLITVACGIACATAAVLVTHDRIHLITLVFGASLIGEAVDYAIQFFAARLDAGASWQAERSLARILPALAVALATSLIGYGALTLTPFPAISQIGLFAFAGLAAAWLSVVLLLPLLARAPGAHDSRDVKLPQRLLRVWQDRATPGGVIALVVALLSAAVPGWLHLSTDDDVRQLVARPAALVKQEASIRLLVGTAGGSRFLLVEGADDEEALRREEALSARLRTRVGQGLAGYAAVSGFVPSIATQAAMRALLQRTLPAEKVAPLLDEAGLQKAAAEAWRHMLASDAPLTLRQWLELPLAQPFKYQVVPTSSGTALIVILSGDDGSLDLMSLTADLPGVSAIDKAASVSALLAEYRRLATLWLPFAGLMVLAVLAWRYGLRQGAAILLPTLAAIGIALGLYGAVGVSLTLFSLLALTLILGSGVNYAIFIVEAGPCAPASFAGVLVSATTTLLAFGLLGLSSMPALHQFGLLLLIGISLAVLFAPMALTLGRARQ
ncbi:MAG: hopanoid biosynthesis associated RND transporter like protein HpnN [Candidatus Accumulibacter adjunctus]|uniref:Hopanoid biosynthesis associated RND transporter like protein HpnN n=1 Tax=Candidatus Accumulibacter adjunctus TaxID=1454001 RepID=A0A011MSN8_9PROT|nr:MAG: hopanoid biosynthesis associated RND transporter like protein HpnN [Candidatus Accumulibacter adjunctus]